MAAPKKRQGKWCVRRHGGGRSGKARRVRADAIERALERRVRQDSKDACQQGLRDYREARAE